MVPPHLLHVRKPASGKFDTISSMACVMYQREKSVFIILNINPLNVKMKDIVAANLENVTLA